MTDYGAAFKLPFTNLRRLSAFLALWFLALVIPAYVFIQIYLKLTVTGAFAAAISGTDLSKAFLSFIPLAIFWLAFTGYVLRLQGLAAKGKNVLPPFDNIAGLFTIALKYLAGIAIYVAMLYGAGILAAILFSLPGALKLLGVLIILPIIGVCLLAVYMMPMLLSHFASENRFSAFFEIGTVRKYAFTMAYFLPWIVSIGYNSIAGTAVYLAAIIVALPFMPLGFLAAALAGLAVYIAGYSIIYLTTTNLYGQAYYDASKKKSGGK